MCCVGERCRELYFGLKKQQLQYSRIVALGPFGLRQTDRQTDRQAGRQAGRQTDRQTDWQTDRQIEIETETETGREFELENFNSQG